MLVTKTQGLLKWIAFRFVGIKRQSNITIPTRKCYCIPGAMVLRQISVGNNIKQSRIHVLLNSTH